MKEATVYTPRREELASFLPPRKRDSHKGTYGIVSLLCGSRAYPGAAKLANYALCALRSGCGISRLCVPENLYDAVAPMLLESTFCPMPQKQGCMLYDEAALQKALAGARACAVGMGWGSAPQSREDYDNILRFLLAQPGLRLIIDADGLNTLAVMERDCLSHAAAQVILTPHPMEFSRLCGLALDRILQDPATAAAEFAEKHDCTVLLKGARSVIAGGEECYAVCRGTSGMATAGSGDVLSGVLAGLCGYLPANPKTAALGAYLCGVAGELAAQKLTEYAMLSSDTAAMLPAAFSQLLRGEEKKNVNA